MQKKGCMIACLLALLLCLFPRTANAVEAYTVENLDITIQVQEDGKLLVFEEYDLNFNYYRSSFTRNITSTYHIPVTTTQGIVYRDYYFPVRDIQGDRLLSVERHDGRRRNATDRTAEVFHLLYGADERSADARSVSDAVLDTGDQSRHEGQSSSL